MGAVLLLASIGLTCRDRSLTGPGLPVRAHFGIAPSFDIASGAPVIRLQRVRAEVFRHPAGTLVVDTVAFFDADSDSLALDISVDVVDPSEQFRVRLSGFTSNGDLVFSADDTVTTVPAGVPAAPMAPEWTYVGADTVVSTLEVAPIDTTLTVSDEFQFRATARGSDGLPVTALVGWISADTNVISIDNATGLAR